jgi:hypothetical protein
MRISEPGAVWLKKYWPIAAQQLPGLTETRRLSQAFALLPPPEQPVRMPELLTEAFKNAPELSAQAKSACRVGQDSAEVPRRQEFGSYLGPFGSMAFWLLLCCTTALTMW